MKNKKLCTVGMTCGVFIFVASFFLSNVSSAEKAPVAVQKPGADTVASAAQEPKEYVDEHDGHDHDENIENKDLHGAPKDEHPEHVEEQESHNHEAGAFGKAAAAGGPAGAKAETADTHEDEIEVTPEGIKLAEITLAKAGIGRIRASVTVSGEVGFNEERLMRLTPRFPGIIKEARFRKGDYVKAGDVVAVIESNESMAPYSLKAPISGRIIEKQAVPGEYVSEEKSIYVLADLSTVWVNLAVYPKDADKVRPGQKVSIVVVGSDTSATGAVSYVTPVIDGQTRTLTACVVLPNDDNAWRPGSFVHGHIDAGEGEKGLVVDKNAVQMLDNKSVVFVQHEPGRFKPVEVVTGENDSRKIRILSGLKAGDEYVNNGAFELKAKIVTSSLGDHAGHGH
ncbi:MAG: efflux RND transporter periplasmic adaptor subunit [Deltaproteobacteria bacterium]|nr:efflux RND transporter periplasmic adaptor subunit [Deltaproteobacteria bacterium]